MDKRMVLITMTGQDRPGIIAAVTAEVAAAGARIRDIEQTVTHTLLSLSLLIDFPPGESDRKPLIKDLLFLAKELGLDLDFQVLSEAEYRRKTTRHAYVVTIMGGEVSAQALARVSRILADHGVNIERIGKLTQGQLRCVEFLISTPPELEVKALTRKLLHAGASLGVDIAVQKESLYRRAKRLVVMDMDSTLIQIEVIDELARLAGVGEQVAAITERAMNGELDFDGSLRARVALLQGMPAAALEEVYRNIPLTPGARTLITVLKRLGFRTAVISGGFRFFTDRLKDDLGLDYAFANQLEIVDGVVTGNLVGRDRRRGAQGAAAGGDRRPRGDHPRPDHRHRRRRQRPADARQGRAGDRLQRQGAGARAGRHPHQPAEHRLDPLPARPLRAGDRRDRRVKLPAPLIAGRLLRRYQRFLADVELEGGRVVTAHTPNTGSMQQCAIPGYRVLISEASNPQRKLQIHPGADRGERPLGRHPHPPHQPGGGGRAAQRGDRRAGRLPGHPGSEIRRQPPRFLPGKGRGAHLRRGQERHPLLLRNHRLLPRRGHDPRPEAPARAAAGEGRRGTGR